MNIALIFQSHPKYMFDYAVKDAHTGDEKEHWETRDGDKVKGKTYFYEFNTLLTTLTIIIRLILCKSKSETSPSDMVT